MLESGSIEGLGHVLHEHGVPLLYIYQLHTYHAGTLYFPVQIFSRNINDLSA